MMLFVEVVFNFLSQIFLIYILATVFSSVLPSMLQKSSQMRPLSKLHPASFPQTIPTKAENYQQPQLIHL